MFLKICVILTQRARISVTGFADTAKIIYVGTFYNLPTKRSYWLALQLSREQRK